MLRTFRSAGRYTGVVAGGADIATPGALPGALVALPAHLYPPESSANISLTNDAAIAGVAGTVVVLLSFLTPPGRRAVFRSFGIFADSPLATTRLTWALRVGGVTVPGLDAVTFIPRVAGSFSRNFDVLAIAQPGQLVEVAVTNVDGAPIRAGATLDGWSYVLQQGAA